MPTSPNRANPALLAAVGAEAPIVVLTGHYGVGKTNLALNLAYACAAAGSTATVADFDLVNPYFRSSDYALDLARESIRLIAPTFAGTALDTPSIGGQLFGEIERASSIPNQRLIIDAGGDDAGATALGCYAQSLTQAQARVLYVVNAFRDLEEPTEVVAVLREIEAACHLKASGIVNVSHLAEDTTPADIERGRLWAHRVAQAARLPLVATCVPAHLPEWCYSGETGSEPVVSVGRYVVTPWQ